MGKKDYILRTLRIAGPCIFENIMVSAVSIIDAAMVGSLGAVATAAVAINSAPSWLLNSLPMGLSVGGTVLVARYTGAGDRYNANNVATQTMGASVIFSSLVCITMLLLSGLLPGLLGADEAVRPLAVSYLRIYSCAIVFHFCGLMASGMLRGSGNTKTPMLISMLTNIVNVCGNFLLIYPSREILVFGRTISMWGAGMGVTGAAIATAFAQSVSAVIMILMICGKKQRVNVNITKIFQIEKTLLLRVLKIGVPAAGERVTINLGQVFYQRLISSLGTASIAAHYLATTAESVSYMPAGGFGVAATTLIGQSLGAEDKEEANTYAKVNILMGLVVGGICFFVLFFLPKYLLGFFTNDQEVIKLGASALRVMAPAEPFFCILIVMNGILRGGGDTKFSFYAGVAGMWGVRLITAFILMQRFGLTGAWVGMAADISVRTAIIYARYRRKKWLSLEV